MIKIKSATIVLAFIATAFISCTKDNNNTYTPYVPPANNNNNNNTPSYNFGAYINTIPFTAISPTAVSSGGTTTITGFNGGNTTITISFPSSFVTNSNYDSASGVVETYISNNIHYVTSGKTVSLRFSAITTTAITGTFSFICVNPGNKTGVENITQGSFYVPFN